MSDVRKLVLWLIVAAVCALPAFTKIMALEHYIREVAQHG
jgi:hypothetical protein